MENKLPKNWIKTELGEILKLKNGHAFKTKDYREEGIPLIRIGNIQQGKVSTEKSIYVDKIDSAEDFIVEKGDVLVAMSGATTGKYGVFNEDVKAYQNQRVGNLKPFAPSLTSRQFIYYLLGGLRKEIEDKAYGGAQPNISPKLIETIQIGFPPLAEQQRIVAKLDTLFTYLEVLNTRLETIPTLLKNFKQAVLTQAVTGKLTEEWSVGKELSIWEYKRAEDVCELITKGTTPKSGGLKETGDIPFLKVYNIVNQKINFKYKSQFISKEINEKVLKRSIVYPKTVIMNIVGPPLGKVAIIPNDYAQWNLNQALAIFKPLDYLKPNFVYYILIEGKPINKINQDFKGVVGQSNISLAQCRDFIFPIPSKEEQTEIVKRVETLFAKADQIESQYALLKAKTDSLPQAILAKAFKGELVEQLPTDGNAKVLLEEIKKLKASLLGAKKTVKKKK